MGARATEEPRAYHHGNLRRAVLDAALALLAERGHHDFTLRELARVAGVTHNAPYRHFASKADVLAALRDEGLAKLAEAEHAALDAAGPNPRDRVQALGESYVRFALEQPTLFRLVLAAPLEEGEPPQASARSQASSESYRLLEATLEEARRAGAVRQDLSARELALAAWAFVHGISTLLVSGRLPATSAAVERYVALLSTMFFEGAAHARPRR
ncbi:MAG: TetR/AcrR family transcriptional regulator [Myxococcales bacterium]|jgi:AcrR family transcriptional regulator|nr:TetR/AcrR family transcriptional regulator [Myxococcales bacterium]